MKTTKKILLTLFVFLGFNFLNALIFLARSESGYVTPGPFATLTIIAMIIMIYQIWKRPKNNNDQSSTGE